MFSHNDAQLVDKAKIGDRKAWFELISRYEQPLFNYCMRMTSQADDAKDLMQEIFISVFNSLNSFKGEGSFKAWLFRIAHFRTMDFYRKKRPHVSLDEGEESEEAMPIQLINNQKPCEDFELAQNQRKILNVMQQLPVQQKVVVELKFFSQFTFEEIASQLGVSTNTVKTRLYSALGKLKNIMEVEHV